LDDAKVFNFSEHWERVFDVLPELAGPWLGYSRTLEEDDEAGRLRKQVRHHLLRGLETEDEAEADVGMELQAMAVETYLVVADCEAFETGLLQILYLDARGDIVRHSRTET
ncbi:hypothetical protein GE09DRAFT_904028, partial [Coniochaeta sp. 2T2.1]